MKTTKVPVFSPISDLIGILEIEFLAPINNAKQTYAYPMKFYFPYPDRLISIINFECNELRLIEMICSLYSFSPIWIKVMFNNFSLSY